MKYPVILLAFMLAFLTGCKHDIYYTGTECIVPDSLKAQYNSELLANYRFTDSSTNEMLKGRGPKMSRYEKEDIDDEYKGAFKLVDESKDRILKTLFAKYCVEVDRYSVGDENVRVSMYETQLKPEDTAIFHAAKRNYIHDQRGE